MAPPVSLPTTVAGLVAELERGRDDAAVMAEAFREFARKIEPPWTKVGTRRRPASGGGPVQSVAVMTRPDVPPGVMDAATVARKLSDALRAAPDVLSALAGLSLPPVPVAAPLYIPDDRDPRVIRDAGTGAINPDPWAPTVPWWPRLSPAAVTAGLTLPDVEISQLFGSCCEHQDGVVQWSASSPWGELVACANTLRAVDGRFAGYDEVARTTKGGGTQRRRQARRAVRAAANQYWKWSVFLEPIADQLAARYAAYIQTLSDGLTALSATEGLDMPGIATSSAVTSLATRIHEAITSGHGGRLTVSENAEVAFSWTPGPAVTLLSFLDTDTIDGRRATVVQAKDSATPVVPVSEGGTKPNVVDFTSEDIALLKFPGQATISTESAMFVKNIEKAVAAVITGQIVRAIEAEASDAITADAGVVVTGATDITAGVLSAVAQIRGNGGAPNVVGLSAEDWVATMTATGAAGTFVNFSNVEAGPAGLWLGMSPVIVPGLTVGNAIVADGRSVTVSEPKGSPLCLVDCLTQASVNKVVITIEAFAVPAVTSPGGVATVAVTP